MSGPVVDVLMPTYNQAEFLRPALEGLTRQTFKSFRLVVCDDASTDGTQIVLRRYPLPMTRLEHAKNHGPATALNTCRDALGPDCAPLRTWVSSDNVMSPDWLEKLVAVMRDEKVGACFSDFTQRARIGKTTKDIVAVTGPWRRGRLTETINSYFGPSFLMRSEVWDGAGPHRGRGAHDYDHWARVEEFCEWKGLEIRHVPGSLCFYGQHEGQWARRDPSVLDAEHWRAEAIKRRAGA